MFLTNHSSAFLLYDVRVVKNVACLSSLLTCKTRDKFRLNNKQWRPIQVEVTVSQVS